MRYICFSILLLLLFPTFAGRVMASSNEQNEESTAIYLSDDLIPFKCVLDTLNAAGDRLVHSEYFIYDITGDGNPELWVKSGSCEADRKLWVYSADNGHVRKIFSTHGGHTDFFLKGSIIGSLTCNTGYGYVSIYSYNGRKIKPRKVEFSVWNDEGAPRAVRKKEQPIVDIWTNFDGKIDFKYLK